MVPHCINSSEQQLRRAASVTPSPRQLAWQQLEFYGFIHFGMNTFAGREWGDGTDSPQLFHPEDLDPDQWVAALKSAGMRGLIFTCKHHDGFCLWPSAFTEYSVKNAPWREGKGDVVALTAEAYRRGGLKFGVYLSPWDRHDPRYGTGRPYDDYYVHQLAELCTRYGELFCVWMDGACGEGPNGKRQVYDWPRYYETVRRLQPGAVLSVCGPDVRWCGNEAGHCRPSEWSVVPAQLMDAAYTAGRSQQADDGTFSRRVDQQDEDLGSREVIAAAGELAWYPAEVDTSVRPGWFYHPEEDSQVRTPEELLDIYLDAVGGNAALLLNVPLAPNGRIAPPDCAALAGLGQKIQNLFALDRTGLGELSASGSAEGHPPACAADGRSDTWWQSAPGEAQSTLTLTFAQPQEISCVVLGEYLPAGQHIEAGEIRADGRTVAAFTVVGHKRICRFAPVRAKQVTVCITASRAEPALRLLAVYREQQAE